MKTSPGLSDQDRYNGRILAQRQNPQLEKNQKDDLKRENDRRKVAP